MLINSTAELKQYLPTSVALGFNDIRPKIRLVEREIIRKIFSPAIYTAVTSVGLSGAKLELQELLAEATAHLALHRYIGFGQTQISSAGIQIATNDNLKTAFEWQIAELRDECATQGWSAIESALGFLDATADTDLKALWNATDTYLAAQKNLLPTLTLFEKHVSIHQSRVLFNKLVPVIADMQAEVIIPAIGQSLFDKVMVLASEADAPKKAILTKVHLLASKALAFKTMATGFLDTLLILSDNGPMVIDGLQSRMPKAVKSAPTDLVKIIAENYATRANGAVRELIEYCQANATIITEYQSSGNYITAEDQTDHIPRNDPEWGIAFL
jgi:hypothetical protein